MNELSLSNNLDQIELEINHYKNIAGKSIWEIGRRLNHVKEHDLTHGEFGHWLSAIGMNQDVANRLMRIAKELPNSDTYQNLGYSVLYLIATLPEDEREKEHVTEKGERKTVDEMTVREIQALKKQLNERNEQLQAQQSTIEKQSDAINHLQNQPPERVEVTKEVVPSDYQSTKEELSRAQRENFRLQEQVKQIQSDLRMSETKYNLLDSSTKEARQIEATIKSLKNERNRLTAMIEFDEKLNEIDQFFDEKMAYLRFKPMMNEVGSYERLSQTIGVVEHWAEKMREIIPRQGAKIIEGEIIDE